MHQAVSTGCPTEMCTTGAVWGTIKHSRVSQDWAHIGTGNSGSGHRKKEGLSAWEYLSVPGTSPNSIRIYYLCSLRARTGLASAQTVNLVSKLLQSKSITWH